MRSQSQVPGGQELGGTLFTPVQADSKATLPLPLQLASLNKRYPFTSQRMGPRPPCSILDRSCGKQKHLHGR